MKHVTSRDNPFFKNLLKLAESARERKKQGLTLIDGVHLIQVYWQRYGLPRTLAVSDSGLQNREIAALLKKMSAEAQIILADGLFKEISPVVAPIGIIALVPTPQPTMPPAQLQLCLMCDAIQDPGNLGSMLRSAAAAGVKDVFLAKGCAFAWSPRVVRAGMGAHFLLSLHEGCDLAALVQDFRGKVVATSPGAETSLFDADLRGPLALLIGNEGAGLPDELLALATQQVKIPMPGDVESLNVAAAAAVCLFEIVRQTRKA